MKNILNNKIYVDDLKKSLKNINLQKLNNSSILITGGMGLIGAAIVDLLHVANLDGLNCNIFIADINEQAYKAKYNEYSDIHYLYYNALSQIEFNLHFDYIIHAAGLASPELYVCKPVDTILSNFIGLLNLLNYSLKNNVKRLLYISSSEVYGNKNDNKSFDEHDFGIVKLDDVRNSYVEAKRASEILCKSFYSQYGLETVIVRPGHIYGPTASSKDKRISSAFAYQAAQGKDLIMKSDGLQIRSYCYCVDCANAILMALLNGINGEAYNIANDDSINIKTMAQFIAKAGNVNLIINNPNTDELRCFNPMNNSSLNNKKIKGIGYKCSFTNEEGLSHMIYILKYLLN